MKLWTPQLTPLCQYPLKRSRTVHPLPFGSQQFLTGWVTLLHKFTIDHSFYFSPGQNWHGGRDNDSCSCICFMSFFAPCDITHYLFLPPLPPPFPLKCPFPLSHTRTVFSMFFLPYDILTPVYCCNGFPPPLEPPSKLSHPFLRLVLSPLASAHPLFFFYSLSWCCFVDFFDPGFPDTRPSPIFFLWFLSCFRSFWL